MSINEKLAVEVMELQVGDVFRWKNTGIGNGFCTSRILGRKVKRLWRHRYWVLETQIEPSGYPHFGTPYYHPILTGKVSDDDFRYITSYGILAEIHRPTAQGLVQVWPEVKG